MTGFVSLERTCKSAPEPESQIRIVPSQLPEARNLLSGLTETLATPQVCPRRTSEVEPVFKSQTRMVRSRLQDASRLPAGSKATSHTRSECPSSVR